MWGHVVSLVSAQAVCGEMISILIFNVGYKTRVLIFIHFHLPCFPRSAALLEREFIECQSVQLPFRFLSQVSSYTSQPSVFISIYHLLDYVSS